MDWSWRVSGILTVIVCWFLCSLLCITMALYAHVVSINYYYYKYFKEKLSHSGSEKLSLKAAGSSASRKCSAASKQKSRPMHGVGRYIEGRGGRREEEREGEREGHEIEPERNKGWREGS